MVGGFKTPVVGTTEYSNTTHHGQNNSTYKGSQLEYYVNAYINSLKPIAGDNITGRLMLKEDLQELKRYYTGNDSATIGEGSIVGWTIKSGLTQPTWIWSNTYWFGSYRDATNAWGVYAGNFEYRSCTETFFFGVRPVIIF